jgi:transposase
MRVVYEAGRTGYRLARACAAAGIDCVVALLRLGEITPVRISAPEEKAARDLVRAREDARGDLMRSGHRLRSRMTPEVGCLLVPRVTVPTTSSSLG